MELQTCALPIEPEGRRAMLRTRLSDALKEAMKAKEARATSTLRLILAALKDRDIAERTKGNDQGLGDEAILEMLQKMVRQRQESIEMYTRGGRSDLAQREGEEIEVGRKSTRLNSSH